MFSHRASSHPPAPHVDRDDVVVVVGGGLAGLSAAATLARTGCSVLVFEAADHLGGRAETRSRDGFDLNLGPHALYRAGGGLDVLRRLGVEPVGSAPRPRSTGVLLDDQVIPATTYVRHRMRQRRRAARAMTGLNGRRASRLAGVTAADWLAASIDDLEARLLAASVLRTVTLTGDHAILDAGAAARQLSVATRGVWYLDGGWAALVEQLADAVRSAGGVIVTGMPVAAVEHDAGGVTAVRLAEGATVRVKAVVVAVSNPARVVQLLDGPASTTVAESTAHTVPLRMAHLDVALAALPLAGPTNVFGLDEPVYLSVPSDVVDVAPPGGAVVHVGRYLRPDEEHGEWRGVLEHVLDVTQPRWREHVVDLRYVPRSLVAADHARAATGGTRGRPAIDVAGVPGLTVAGDWVGPDAMLADAALLSGAAAATALLHAAPHRAPRRPPSLVGSPCS